MSTDVAGLLLAAGASRRLGTPKQLLVDDDGVPAVVRLARALRAAGCASVFVVTGSSSESVAAALRDEPVTLVPHAEWAEGMGSSIAAGTAAASATPCTGLLITPCDMPAVTSAHLRALRECFDGMQRVASEYADRDGVLVRGIPAILPRSDWPWLQQLTGDRGARPLLREADVLTVALPRGAFDLDTPADVARWRDAGAVVAPPAFPSTSPLP